MAETTFARQRLCGYWISYLFEIWPVPWLARFSLIQHTKRRQHERKRLSYVHNRRRRERERKKSINNRSSFFSLLFTRGNENERLNLTSNTKKRKEKKKCNSWINYYAYVNTGEIMSSFTFSINVRSLANNKPSCEDDVESKILPYDVSVDNQVKVELEHER